MRTNNISKQFQDQLILELTRSTPAETQDKYQAGDFALFERDKSVSRPNKLAPDFLEPFEVISQNKNDDVTTRNLVYGNVREYHVERLKPFFYLAKMLLILPSEIRISMMLTA